MAVGNGMLLIYEVLYYSKKHYPEQALRLSGPNAALFDFHDFKQC